MGGQCVDRWCASCGAGPVHVLQCRLSWLLRDPGDSAPPRKDLEIVGVVKDTKYQRLQEPTRRIAYLPYLPFAEALRGVEIVAEIRTTLPAAAMVETVRKEIRGIDREIPLRFETLTARIHDTLMTERVVAVVSAFLGAIALLLATASLYGLMAWVRGISPPA